MSDRYNLQRFIDAQSATYATALAELEAGRKLTHWMWFIFPQLAGLGRSAMAQRYAITDMGEARAYLAHPLLGPRLAVCAQALLAWPGRTAAQILGAPDDMKLRSCMTLFALAAPQKQVFTQVLGAFFAGQGDERTLEALGATGMPESPDGLSDMGRQTLAHYERNAESFREGTRDHDVSQNIDALLRHLQVPAPWQILDMGCGPGRDLLTFKALGHVPVGLDGCERFVEMARQDSGCEVWRQDFLDLDLPAERFDGIFANATLFHIPSRLLPTALRALFQSLKPGGVLLCSHPRGDDHEGRTGARDAV